ncbi:MAG: hypothetical protein ACRDNS_01255, partial [Trebonia sp.]
MAGALAALVESDLPVDARGARAETDGVPTAGVETEGTVTGGVVTEGTVTVGVLTEGTVTMGVAIEGRVTVGVVIGGVVTDGIVSEGVRTDRSGGPVGTTAPLAKAPVVSAGSNAIAKTPPPRATRFAYLQPMRTKTPPARHLAYRSRPMRSLIAVGLWTFLPIVDQPQSDRSAVVKSKAHLGEDLKIVLTPGWRHAIPNGIS